MIIPDPTWPMKTPVIWEVHTANQQAQEQDVVFVPTANQNVAPLRTAKKRTAGMKQPTLMQAFGKAQQLSDERTPEQKDADGARQEAREQVRRAQDKEASAARNAHAAENRFKETFCRNRGSPGIGRKLSVKTVSAARLCVL